jgi:hypothetical protein
MPDYSRGKVYKIVCNITGKIYIGSTTETTLARRLTTHIRNYKQYLKGKHGFTRSFEIFNNGSYDIILLENVPCNQKDELHKIERHYQDSLECVNKNKVGRTTKQWVKDNKEKVDEWRKNYSVKNKDKIEEYRNSKYVCDCGITLKMVNKSKHIKTKRHLNFLKITN